MQQKYLIRMMGTPVSPINDEIIDDEDDKTIAALIMTKHSMKYFGYNRKGQLFSYNVGKKTFEGKLIKIFVEKNKFFVQKGEEYIPIQF